MYVFTAGNTTAPNLFHHFSTALLVILISRLNIFRLNILPLSLFILISTPVQCSRVGRIEGEVETRTPRLILSQIPLEALSQTL